MDRKAGQPQPLTTTRSKALIMSATTDFIAELIRAANEIYLLTPLERVRLIERAVATIQAQRELLAMRSA